ncbi:MAG: crotonase/enoyl-CoA hydratase family protein, partial [Epsilonproteobacteria bacterium]|nr:crotonase/enoyl-CoA hydratase family protein [Campylobacterota bacterium]
DYVMDNHFNQLLSEREEISVRYDSETAAIWCYFNPKVRPCYTLKMLQEIRELQLSIISYFRATNMKPLTPIKYFIVASQTPGVFNYGGDLNLFSQLIAEQNYDKLIEYGKQCIDIAYLNHLNLNLPITTISLMNGDALGGGFEAALSSNIIIAEENIKLGFPEIRFNLFPGMGAYSFLARAIGIQNTEEMITTGKIYDAKTLYQQGAITILARPNHAEQELTKFIKTHTKAFNGMQAIKKARHVYEPIEYSELFNIVKIWADAALKLEKKDIKMMQKLVQTQSLKTSKMTKIRTKQDRRISHEPTLFPFIDRQGNMITTDRRRGIDRRLCS